MPFYENVFIARQDLSTTAAETLADKFASILENQGGSVKKREYWGLRALAYPIKKNRKGHYFLFGIEASSEAVREVERSMRLEENLLRHLTLKIEEIDPEPSPIMRTRPHREDDSSPASLPTETRDDGTQNNGTPHPESRKELIPSALVPAGDSPAGENESEAVASPPETPNTQTPENQGGQS